MCAAKKPPPGKRPLKTLERVLSKAGLGSRTDAREWIADGRVKVNGRLVRDPDHWVDLERDRVVFDGRPVEKKAAIYLALHKPTGYLTTWRDPQGRPTIYDLLPENDRWLVAVGRLDLETSGLLLLTNDTAFAERMTNPDYHVPKTYRVTSPIALTDEQLQTLCNGIELRDGMTRPAIVERLPGSSTMLDITITEGRNRQVRRMIEALGANVVALVRTSIGPLKLGTLAAGSARDLTADEFRALESAARKR